MAVAPRASRVRFLRALRSRPFALLWSGQTISSLGDGAFQTALAWQVLVLTGSGAAMGAVLIARGIPMLVFLLIGGVAADRLPRRLVMLASDAGRAAAVFAIALLGSLHLLQLWHLVALGLAFGVVDGFFMPAYQSITPGLVEVDELPSANGLTGLSRQMSMLVGPIIGAGLVAAVNPAAAFAFDGLTFVASAFLLLAMPARRRHKAAANPAGESGLRGARGVLADMREGFRYILGSSWLWATIAIASIGNVAWAGTSVIALPKLIHDVYHQGVGLFGLLTTMVGLGSIVAMLLAAQVKRLRHRGPLAYAGIIASSIGLVVIGLPLPPAAFAVVAGGASFVIGAGLGLFTVIWETVLQEMVPQDKLGRVSSVDWLGSLALQPIGLGVAGVLTDRLGPAWVFLAGGGLNLALNLLGLAVRGIRELD